MKKDNYRSMPILLSLIAVCAGASIYILFRPAEASFLNWFALPESAQWLDALRVRSLSVRSFLPQWLVYSLPNGLWAFAYTLLVLSIWRGSSSILKYFWFLSIPLLVFGFEMLQFSGDLQGTFCLNDIIFSAIGISFGVIIAKINSPILNKETLIPTI